MLANTGRFGSHGGPPAERGSGVRSSPVSEEVETKALKVLKQTENAIYHTTA